MYENEFGRRDLQAADNYITVELLLCEKCVDVLFISATEAEHVIRVFTHFLCSCW